MKNAATPYLSVIIPSYNRADKLDKALAALFAQSLAKEAYEIWVVNDGSTDHTSEIIEKWEKTWDNLHSLNQNNKGQSTARQNALEQAKGQIVLFIGDDIYGGENFLKSHTDFHLENPQEEYAALGLTEWDPKSPINAYMKWLTHGGPQFAYHRLRANMPASFWFFYTSNISIKKSLLKKEPFDTSFKGYGWEDIELGYRLYKNHQLNLIFKPEALAFHDHYLEESELPKKMYAIGKNGLIFQEKHPELKVLPKGIKKWILKILTQGLIRKPLRVMSQKIKRLRPYYWWIESKHQLLKGMAELEIA